MIADIALGGVLEALLYVLAIVFVAYVILAVVKRI